MGDPAIDEIAALLRSASRVLFVTGAGISADSGMPTYRGVGGLYENTDTAHGLPIEVVLSGPQFSSDPAVTWNYLLEIERACRGVQPNAGHRFIAELEQDKPETWVLTQNVDGLHHAAGSRNLLEIHGRVTDLYCVDCDYRETVDDYRHLDPLPRCPACNGVVRPDVVLFGELLPEATVATLYRELDRGFDLVFSVGTSSLFPYISEPLYRARMAGRPTVEINPLETEVSELADYALRMGAAEALTRIRESYQGVD